MLLWGHPLMKLFVLIVSPSVSFLFEITICVNCGRQFNHSYETKGYSDNVKRSCLKMYVNGMGFRGIERVTTVSRTTIMDWVKQVGKLLPDSYNSETIPEVGDLCW